MPLITSGSVINPVYGSSAPAGARKGILDRVQEQSIHRALCQHITVRLVPDAFAFHVPNGGARPKTEAAIFDGLGHLRPARCTSQQGEATTCAFCQDEPCCPAFKPVASRARGQLQSAASEVIL
jgi:hypothetical protein